jgi:hypothetical protein
MSYPAAVLPMKKLFAATVPGTYSALLFYEGEHYGGVVANRSYVEKIYESTGKWLAEGQRKVHLYSHTTPHEGLGADNVIGTLADFTLREITAEDVEPVFAELVGKMGIFAEATLNEKGAARFTPDVPTISVGLLESGAIFEVSIAPAPVLPAAMLRNLSPATEQAPALTFAIMNLAQQIKNRDLLQRLFDYWDGFTSVLHSIERATDQEVAASGSTKDALTRSAFSDFIVLLQSLVPPAPQTFSLPPFPPPFDTIEQRPDNFEAVFSLYNKVLIEFTAITPDANKFDIELPRIENIETLSTVAEKTTFLEDVLTQLGRVTYLLEYLNKNDSKTAPKQGMPVNTFAVQETTQRDVDSVKEFAKKIPLNLPY